METTYPCPNCGDELAEITECDDSMPVYLCPHCNDIHDAGGEVNNIWWYEDHLLEELFSLDIVCLFVEPALDNFWYEKQLDR